MSESNETTGALDRIRGWREQYRLGLSPSPLEDVTQLVAQLDMTHAHPSGIAQLFASGHVTLDSLFRDSGMLRAAGRRIERVLDDSETKSRINGVGELSLVVGVATWKGNQMPVLMYPVEVRREGRNIEQGTVIAFTGRVRLNAAFASVMRENSVTLDESRLFDGSNYESGTPETSAVFAAIADRACEAFPDFEIERHIILGCFMDSSAQMLVESQKIIDQLSEGQTGNIVLDALAGDKSAVRTLEKAEIPPYSPFDSDPHSEYEVGDVDNTVRYAARLAAAGHSIFVDSVIANNTAEQALAIASRCVMNGRSVLYVPCVNDQKRRFEQAVVANEMGGQVLDIADANANDAIDRQLIAAVSFQSGVASSRFDQIADELVGVRSRLTRYLGDLHGISEEWGVSAYQTIQNLAQIAMLPTHPATHVRLDMQTAHDIADTMEQWAGKLKRAADLGEFSITEGDTAWYRASIYSEDEAVTAYQRVVELLCKVLPALRDQVSATVEACGFPVPSTAQEWERQVTVLKNLRRVLDVFQPEIFERDIASMLEATKSKESRKTEGSSMGFWERRRHIKEAKSMLRVGAQVENLHEALQVVSKQADQWRMFVPHGGWPVLPPKLDDIIETQNELARDLTSLDAVLAGTPQGGELETVDLNQVEERLKALHADKQSLDNLPERARLEREFHDAGLDELVADFSNRGIDGEAVAGELQLAWWTTAFEDIVRSSAIISNQDGYALQDAADRFAQVDVEHVRSAGPMVAQESMRRLCDMLFSRTQEANLLHTSLVGSHKVSLNRLHREHTQILAAAKPILMATPATLAAITDPVPLADVAIIDAGAHIPSVELLSIVSRAKQVVIIAHRQTVTSEGVRHLIDLLPSVKIADRPLSRAPRLDDFLESEGYGTLPHNVVREEFQGRLEYHFVPDATGVPSMASGLVESSQQEIDKIIDIINRRAASFTVVPASYVLTVVTLTHAFRLRLGAELKTIANRDKSKGMFLRHVRIIDIADVAGAHATDAILAMCYAKTTHGRLLQQFGTLESDGGRGMLLDALAVPDRHLDIVSAFSSSDMDDERLHQAGPKMLKTVLGWAEGLQDEDNEPVRPKTMVSGSNVLFDDLASRIRARGLNVAVEYGFEDGARIPLVVGLQGKPFALAVLTDDAQFMKLQSTRERHRALLQNIESLGWSVMTVWSVGAFVNPDREVDRIVSCLSGMYQEDK
ncbi:MAG TPA: helicase [Bifidobacterium sp.]|nr:helicase [Bifidobacterium sp.]